MGPVPKELDLDRIVGMRLLQVCLEAHEFRLVFEDGSGIRCLGAVAASVNGIYSHVFLGGRWQDVSPLTQIVGRKVNSWDGAASHVLQITFIPEAELTLISEDSKSEDFIFDPEDIRW